MHYHFSYDIQISSLLIQETLIVMRLFFFSNYFLIQLCENQSSVVKGTTVNCLSNTI